LAFVPFTVSLEMMAEAAALLMPGRHVVGAKNAQALRWIDVDPDAAPVTLALHAKRMSPDAVRVVIWKHREGTPPEARTELLADGTFLFADEYPETPAPAAIELVNARPVRHTATELYAERRLFHGPRFQGVVSADGIGDNGVDAKLDVLPTDDLLSWDREPVFHFDPCLLDAAGQLVGYWPIEYCTEGFVLFPIRINQLTVYGGARRAGERTTCRVRITGLTARQMKADIDVIGADGALWMRINGWEDWRFGWEVDFYDFWRFPNRYPNGAPLDVPLPAGAPDVTVRRVQPFGEADKPMWEYLWAHMVLSRSEMAQYRALQDRASRAAFLYPLAVAKDAVRDWMQRHAQRRYYPADIEIVEESGAHRVAGPAAADFRTPLCVSVSYDAPLAVAAAAAVPIGIEVEAVGHWEGGVEEGRVRKQERALMPVSEGEERDEWLTRLWCARKAAAKAAGLDIRDPGTSQALAIEQVAANGAITVSLASASGRQAGDTLSVSTTRNGDYIIALAIRLETR
jgi:phosphopantetheinyl transferase (holo-ACP synthase)